MLSIEQRRHQQLYKFRDGMLNIAWIAGVARSIDARKGLGYIQQSNNLNQWIQFHMDEGDTMPQWVREGVNVKVLGRLKGARSEGEPTVVLKALAFETPTIYDMPPRAAWERSLREGVPSDAVRPTVYRPEDDRRTMGGLRVSDVGNMVKVAGFVSSFFVEPAGMEKPDGTVTQGCLILTLRQTRDKEDLIPVRCYGRGAEPLARRLSVGDPVKVEGSLRVRVKRTGEPADAAGIFPVHRFPYVHTPVIGVADPQMDIQGRPDWVDEMQVEHQSKRSARLAAARGAAGAAQRAAPAPATETQAAAEAQPRVLDADLNIDPAMLEGLGSNSSLSA